MKMKSPLVTSLLVIGLLTSCGKSNFSNILHYRNTPQKIDQSAQIKEISSSGKVDMIWVIDNSGSMSDYQQKVIDNTAVFIKDFISQGLDWKLGLLSTDDDYSSRNPYTEFAGAPPLNSTVPDPAAAFAAAVATLGTSGSGTEKTFDPILTALNRDQNFLRPSSVPLVFILITDAPEQSKIDAATFIKKLRVLIGADRQMFVYTVLAAIETQCPTQEDHFNYAGSPYEAWANNGVASKTFPICRDFGTNLASLGTEIVTRVSHPSIYLTARPNIATLQVFYQGRELPPGATADGGYWRYDATVNAIVFNSLDFSQSERDSVQIRFSEDLGV
jgi:hypothetical protein